MMLQAFCETNNPYYHIQKNLFLLIPIPVIMEVALQPCVIYRSSLYVSILVIMEVVLQRNIYHIFRHLSSCFNPCYNGSCIATVAFTPLVRALNEFQSLL